MINCKELGAYCIIKPFIKNDNKQPVKQLNGLPKSSSLTPAARNKLRCGARSTPCVIISLRNSANLIPSNFSKIMHSTIFELFPILSLLSE